MRWLLESPGYDIDDRRHEVVGDLLKGEAPYLINSRTLTTAALALAHYEDLPAQEDAVRQLRSETKETRAGEGVFWSRSAPEVPFTVSKPVWVWRKMTSTELSKYSPWDGYVDGSFPLALKSDDTNLFLEAVAFCANQPDQWEMEIFVDATTSSLLSLMQTLEASR